MDGINGFAVEMLEALCDYDTHEIVGLGKCQHFVIIRESKASFSQNMAWV